MAITPAHDSVIDSPTNNFATWNVLDTTATVSDGNLKVLTTNVYTFSTIFLPKSAGKFYVEYYVESMGYPQFGIYNHDTGTKTLYQSTNQTNESILIKNVNTADAFTHTSGDIISVLVDTTNETIQWFKNGGSTSSNATSSYTLDDLADNDYSFYTVHSSGAGTSTLRINFGQDHTFGGYPNSLASSSGYSDANGIGDFYYSPPTGALALCTSNIQSNLAIDPAVDDLPEDYFKCVTYSGTGSANNINVGFTPDLVWIKCRDNSFDHMIYDSIRGVNKNIYSNGTSQEVTTNNSLTEFITTGNKGFQVVSDNGVNNSSYYYISWNWKSGGAPSGSNIYMKDGTGYTNSTSDKATVFGSASNYTITPISASIGTKQGFSIVKFNSGSAGNVTIPHGLNAKPDFVLLKALESSASWYTFHNGLSDDTKYLYLNSTFSESGLTQNTRIWGGRTFDSNVISAETGYTLNANENYIAYCWKETSGYSAFGSYTAVSGSDNAFVALGFSPSLIIIKNITGGDASYSSWFMADNARSQFNPSGGSNVLWANSNVAEGKRGNVDATTVGVIGTNDYLDVDFLSNGFKIRASSNAGEIGKEDAVYLYACWAEMPQKFAVAR